MKYIFSILVSLILSAQSVAQQKSALLMVHFGTTFDDTRALTIDAINQKAMAAFLDMKFMEAYTSRIVIKRLKERGIDKPTPREALLRLAADGYTHVFIQSTNIIDGIEANALREEADYMTPFFKDVRIGHPLLYSVDDCLKVVDIMNGLYPARKKHDYLFVGHGTSSSANAVYSQIDYMFSASGRPDCKVCTVDGYPTLDTAVDLIKAQKSKSVTLLPFMFVAGDHARNDIAGDMKEELDKQGFETDVEIIGLGQIPQIQDIFIEHIRQGLKEKPLSPSEHKRKFLAQ